ncbi:MAG TPA: hypothetical protein DIC56_09980 [Rhizobium sp.]|nr:hypothetical protein [Rhizobium sp.]
MTPKEYMKEILLPTLSEYEEDTQSRRRAYLACIVVYHLSDYLKKAGADNPAKKMCNQCTTAWNVVHAVAIGAKHRDNAENKNPLKFTAGSDAYRPPARAGLLECGWSILGDHEGSIVIDASEDNLMADVLQALRGVLRQYHVLYGETYLQ